MVDIKQAISAAKAYAIEVLGDLTFLLEEVSSDEAVFRITLSFPARTLDQRLSGKSVYNWTAHQPDGREYKEFVVDKSTGVVSAMSIRQIA